MGAQPARQVLWDSLTFTFRPHCSASGTSLHITEGHVTRSIMRNSNWSPRRPAHEIEAVAVHLRDLTHVIARLTEGRNAFVRVHRRLARVISRQREPHITAEVIQKLLQVPYPSINVFRGVKAVVHLERACCARHDLHQSHSVLARDCMRV